MIHWRMEGPDRSYRPGETIAGAVSIGETGPTTVTLAFETSGECDSERAVLREAVVESVDGSPRFSFAGPRWPPSYQGTLFAGRWYLEVTPPGSGSGTDDTRREVVVGDDTPLAVRRAVEAPTTVRTSPALSVGLRAVALVCIQVLFLGVLVLGLLVGSAVWVAGLLGAIVLTPATVGAVTGALATRSAGQMAVDLAPAELGSPDRALPVEVRIVDDTAVDEVTATLVVRELTQRNVGYDNPTYEQHVLHQRQITLDRIEPGRYRGSVPTVADPVLPPTMSHSTAQVGWSLHVRARLTGSPDHELTIPLVARPASGPAAEVQVRWTSG